MLSSRLIERHVRSESLRNLLRQLMDNDPALPRVLMGRLVEQTPAVLALAMRRWVELSYRPTRESRLLTVRLLDEQRKPQTLADPATAASLAAAWNTLRRHHAPAPPAIAAAHEEALAALARHQGEDGLLTGPTDHTPEQRVLVTGYTLLLLADDPAFQAAVRWDDLIGAFERHLGDLPREVGRLCQAACLRGPSSAAAA